MTEPAQSNIVPFEQRLEKRLRGMLEALPLAVSWARLSDQHIVFVNEKFTQLFGYVVGDHPTVADWIEQTYINPEHVKRAGDMWYPHFGVTDVEVVEIPQVEVDVQCKDSSVKTTLLSGMIVPDMGWALAIFTDITERKEAEAHIERLALEDPLTGLGNRRAFSETLKAAMARAARQKTSTALMLVDLDNFKPLNDTLGHDSGDKVLQTVAGRLRRGVRAIDYVCRLGGDEFGIIVDGVTDPATAEEVARRTLEEMGKPLVLDGQSVDVGASIGIALYPEDADDGDALYRNADSALYRAKDAGRGRWSR